MIKENLKITLGRLRSAITRKRLAILGGVIGVVLVVTPIATYAKYAQDISDRERLMNRKSTGLILRDKNGEIFYEFGKLNRSEDVKLSQVSDVFEKALIASEDQDFYKHEGYSIKGIASATYANFMNKDATRYGGSTITQQLVKNKLLTTEKSYLRKYQEVAMAVAVERRYSKEEILEMYINSVYFGEGAFGITDAAKTYFNKSPQDLTLAESSALVGLLPAPAVYSPISGDKEQAKIQREEVLRRMLEAGAIGSEERQQAAAEEIKTNPATAAKQEHAQHFAMMVIEELKGKYGEETVTRSGFDVTTTLDLNWQKTAENNARERAQALASAGARNAGVVAIDPKNGEIRALVGSVDWNNPTFGKVNMATSPRQPGSSFKPIYYTEAIDKKVITAATIMEDKAKTYGGNYAPTNYDFKYRGNIPVRNALAQSLNIPAVDVMQKLGVNESAQAAQRLGISTVNEPDKYGLSLALGTAEVKLQEITGAYTAFANGGKQHKQAMVTTIKNKYDEQVFKHKTPDAKQVVSPEASYIISSILSDNQARAATFGNSLNIANRKVAVKTGTTNDSKDAWTIGYTPQVVVGVWMGNNENEAMRGLAGSSSAGGVWRNTISEYIKNLPKEDFQKPSNVITAKTCNTTGPAEDVFIKGTEPKECSKSKETEEPKKKEEEEKPAENQERQNERQQEEPRNEERNPQQELRDSLDTNNDSGSGGRGAEETTTDSGSGETTTTTTTN